MSARVGLALGSGAARGWAHIGVLRALDERGIRPDVVSGTSIGAMVGAAWCAGKMDVLADWVCGLTRVDIVRILDVSVGHGGFVEGRRLMGEFGDRIQAEQIESLQTPFVAVATDVHSGRECWLREGSLVDAVRASISLPGIFTPVRHQQRWLVDGGLVNPVPISVCRALQAEIVLAVNLNGDLLTRRSRRVEQAPAAPAGNGMGAARLLFSRLRGPLARLSLDHLIAPRDQVSGESVPGLFDVTSGAINIMQDRITRSRMAGDPPEAIIAPRLSHFNLMDFHRAEEAIEEGYRATRQALPEIEHLLGPVPAFGEHE